MITIINSNLEHHQLNLLREWLIAEWGEIDPFERKLNGIMVPPPLLLLEDEKLIGGLAFTSAVNPDSKEFAIWVNALLVLPDYRGRGLASKLLKRAISHAKEFAVTELFAFTDVCALYQKQGWQIIDDSKASTVLRIIIKS